MNKDINIFDYLNVKSFRIDRCILQNDFERLDILRCVIQKITGTRCVKEFIALF